MTRTNEHTNLTTGADSASTQPARAIMRRFRRIRSGFVLNRRPGEPQIVITRSKRHAIIVVDLWAVDRDLSDAGQQELREYLLSVVEPPAMLAVGPTYSFASKIPAGQALEVASQAYEIAMRNRQPHPVPGQPGYWGKEEASHI